MPVLGFDASPELVNQIEQIQRRTDSATRAEAIRKALKTYDYLTKKSKEGKTIKLVDENGQVEDLPII